ncbi:DGQHR domain-containing protein [Butyrivibrio sp. AE3009]|uniref:DGQHR domain-containing protein n=1 Tax=Butyrivibrio sp. AE3009 TaxID=1280666 RepID=UPI0003B563CB|nr:DGQHR domain-containing protein [Butyrivibrio sp. AE3009]
MRKIYVFEVTQHNMKRYVGKAPAKDFVRLATTVELSAVQEAQRPINPKRLEEISQFVQSDGTLSTSVVIGTKNDLLNVKKDKNTKIPELFYIDFPETEEEFNEFKNSFDIMDGQHRLFSFLPDYIKIGDDVTFEITFEMYIKPTLREKRIIFKNTNEKQEKVASNLLMWFREKLNMLSGKEQSYHGIVSLLNNETVSPLKGRIIMGAEKVTGGLKAQQVITILDKSDIKNIGGNNLDEEKMLQLISNYLHGWEQAVGTKISDRDAQYGPFSKISGLRFMILMLPTFFEQAKNERATFDETYIKNKINTLFSDNGIAPSDVFDKNSAYYKSLGGNPFGGETPITMLAKDWSNKLKSLTSGDFDPLA